MDKTKQTAYYVPDDNDLRESLANYAHVARSWWMQYIFSKCSSTDAGELVIPAWAVALWTRQMSTPYWDLPGNEASSDRDEADKIMKVYYTHQAKRKEPAP